MAIAELVLSPVAWLFGLIIFIAYRHFFTYRALRRIPGPFIAKFSKIWLLITARRGKRYILVDEAHEKYGPVIRIQPNHISINDDRAIPLIYGHGNGFLKSYVYEY